MELNVFKEQILHFEPQDIVRTNIIFGECEIINPEEHLSIRKKISERFGLHPNAVVIVGSAKLGFSISPNKNFTQFHDKSDIDVALISPNWFDSIWEKTHRYAKSNPLWPEQRVFFNYLKDGWIRPDKLPNYGVEDLKNEWFDFFRTLEISTTVGTINVKAALDLLHNRLFLCEEVPRGIIL